MVQQIINVGIKANTGGGDPLRDAMIKVNENFTEVYGKLTALEDGNVVTDIKGNVFAEDSTLLVDGINSSINLDGTVKGDIVPDTDVAYDIGSASNRFRDLYLSGSTIDLGGTTLSIVGGELQLGGVKIPTQAEVTASIAGAVAAPTGDLTGSVFADDSTLLVDAVAGKIVGTVDTFEANITNLSSQSGGGLNIVGQVGDTNGYGILITGGRGLDGNGGLVQINGGPGTVSQGVVNIGQSSGEVRIDSGSSLFLSSVSGDLSIGRVGGATDVYGEVEFNNGTTLFQAGNSVSFNGPVNFTNATITGLTLDGDVTGSVFADDSTLLVDGVNGKLIGPLLTENIAHPSNDGLGIRLNNTDQSTLMVAKQSFDRTFDEIFDAGYTLSILNTPNRVRVTFDVNNGLYFRGLMERWTVLYDDIRNALTSDFEYDYSNIRLSLEPDTYDIVTNVVDVVFVSDNVYDIEIDQDPIVVLADAGAEPGEIGQIALRYDYNNTMGFDVERNRYGIAVDHEDIDIRAGRDVDLHAVDDFRARAGSSFNLTLESKDGRDPVAGININLESYDDGGNFIDKIWTFQFDGNLRLPVGGDIVDDNGNSVFDNITGLNNNNDINIAINNNDSSTYTWNFGNTGAFTAPGSITITADGNGTLTSSSGYAQLSGDNGAELYHDNGSLVTSVIGVEEDSIALVVTDMTPGSASQSSLAMSSAGNAALASAAWINLITNNGPSSKTFRFDSDGYITFPDATVQTTAYPGVPTLISSGDTAPGSAVVAGNTEINFNFSGVGTKFTVEQDAITIGSGVTVSGFVGDITGDITGSVFADDSTLLVDGVAGKIVGPIETAQSITVTGNINFNGARTISPVATTTFTGSDITIQGGTSTEAGAAGGDVFIDGGLGVGAGDDGVVRIDQNAAGGVWIGKADGTGDDIQTYSRMRIHRGVTEDYEAKTNATGVVEHDCDGGHLFYHTSPTANWTVNLTNLNAYSSMSTNIVIVIEQGGTPYYPSALQIGGSAQTIKWLGNVTPTPQGNKTEIATFTIFYNGSAYNVLGSYSSYG